MDGSRTILHADLDAFYASVEQHDHPELCGRPVIVGGTGPRGVVSAASYEARGFGVHSAMPAVEARRLCPGGVFLPGRMSRYAEVSRIVQGIFREFTPVVEPLSLDEAYLDVTGSLRLFGGARRIGEGIRRRVREATGLTVSVGIGPGRLVAKIASTLSKPDGLMEVAPRDAESFLRPLPIDRIRGVGPAARARLTRVGIRTIGDLADAPYGNLESALGSFAATARSLACGLDPRPVVPGGRRRSYGEENTFARDQVDGPVIREAIRSHAEAVARRLRADRRLASTIVLKLKLSNRTAPGKYPLLTRSETLARPTDDGLELAGVALRLWDDAGRDRTVRLIGVSVRNLVDEDHGAQIDLFDDPRRSALNRALDEIAERHGEDALRRGATRGVERASPTHAIKDREGH